MKPKELAEYTTEELIKTEKKQSALSYANAAVFIILLLVCIYITVTKGLGFFAFMPLFFFPVQLIHLLQLKKIREEIKSRKN